MTSDVVSTDAVLAALRPAWPHVALVDGPHPITGGQWASIHRLRLTGLPDGIPSDLVLRVAPHAEMAAKEQAIQAAAAGAGIATPRIHLAGSPGGPLREAWAVMDLAPGRHVLTDLDGAAALAGLPRILRQLPHQLAAALASVHHLDPAIVVDHVRAAAPSVPFTVDELWPHLRARAEAAARPDLTEAIERLGRAQPPQDGAVVCHGDLHPLNLLADGARVTILDWTNAIVAPPAFDVAFTALLLGHPPLPGPAALRPALDAGGQLLARRTTRLYRSANPTADLTHVEWYTALHAARILTDRASWARTNDPRLSSHPWRFIERAATRALARATG